MRIPNRVRNRTPLALAVAAAAFLGSACAEQAPQDVLAPEGWYAEKADDLWNLVFPIAVVIFFIVQALLIYALVRFRHRPGREAQQFHGNTKLEVVLTAIPALILAGIAVPTVRTVFELTNEPTENVLNVTVKAHRFWWEYQYPDLGLVTANELHIPTGQPVRVRLEGIPTDRVDSTAQVIHAFWVPRLAGKQDVVPGRVNYITLEADEPGIYAGQCTEFCGLGHAEMRLRVIAHDPEAFDEWARDLAEPASAPTDSLAREGERLFNEGQFPNGPPCVACHAVDATYEAGNEPQQAGPNLADFANRDTFAAAIFENTEENLAPWLRDPNAVKEGARMPALGLSEDQIRALIAYLQTLE
ncbi:MAG TPA: cytochrome c oxidase subunit II [Actinomycetota bacterium]|jgi:cytochrome c oxidase subunit II|nr:cytochrome c oxidase subunit II [Actinomycetota bacterium]